MIRLPENLIRLNKHKGLIGFVLLFSLLPAFLSGNAYYIYLLNVLLIYFLATTSFNLIGGYAGMVSIGHGAIFGIGAYTFAILTTRLEISAWLAMLIGAVAAGIIGMLICLPSFRLSHFYFAMVTLGFSLIFIEVAVELEWLTSGIDGISHIPRPTFRGMPLTDIQFYYISLIIFFILFLLIKNFVSSRFGRGVIAIRDNEIVAKSIGINVPRLKLVTFLISSMAVGFAGTLFAGLTNYISPGNFSIDLSVLFLTMVFLGGSGTLFGPILGTILLYLLPEVLSPLQDIKLILYGAILIIIVLILPKGLVSIAFLNRSKNRKPVSENGNNISRNNIGSLQMKFVSPEKAGVLSISNVTKLFGGVKALDNVNLTVPMGKIIGLMGPNGSGKTTLLNIVTGYYGIDEGDISFHSRTINKMQIYQRANLGIGRTFQTPRLLPDLTVLENVMLGTFAKEKSTVIENCLKLPRAKKEERESMQRAASILDFVGLNEYMYHPAGVLPHGLKRLLEIARVLVMEPNYLLLDEPAAGLSGSELERLKELLCKIADLNYGILIVEHHVELLVDVCDEIIVLSKGSVIAQGVGETVQNSNVVKEVYLGTALEC